ncbi:MULTISPECIES: DNA-binding protein [Streptomyces]|uniref:DNA-binding protein n=1 Tax=Streptomyces TaxID=1883 RepID=UPI002E773E4A|nr:DNA-binding protein [Streptomyces sp. BE133]MEE1805528.1 DNA-binding protein [Streptomyces sp. BE133]
MNDHAEGPDALSRPEDPDHARARREHVALRHVAERLAGAGEPEPVDPAGRLTAQEAVHLIASWAGGSGRPGDAPEIGRTDVMAALTLLPRARADLDVLEASLLFVARELGLTWQDIAYGLGLRSPQAAQKRAGRGVQSPGATTPARLTTPAASEPKGECEH